MYTRLHHAYVCRSWHDIYTAVIIMITELMIRWNGNNNYYVHDSTSITIMSVSIMII